MTEDTPKYQVGRIEQVTETPKRYTQPCVQTQPGPEFRVAEVPLFKDPAGQWVKYEDYEQLERALAQAQLELQALRSAHELCDEALEIGEQKNAKLRQVLYHADIVCAVLGAHGSIQARDDRVVALLDAIHRADPK